MIPVSLLSAYLYCPRKLYLQKVLKKEEPVKETIIKGQLRHQVIDSVTQRERELILLIQPDDPFERVLKRYEAVYKNELRNAIIVNKRSIERLNIEPSAMDRMVWSQLRSDVLSRAEFVHEFAVKSRLFGPALWENLTPKIKSEYTVESESLGLKGVIDQVHIYYDSLVPFELKTGSSPNEGIWPGHRIQLAAYMLLLEDKFDMNITEGIIYYLDSKEKRPLRMNPFLREDVIKTKILVEKVLSSKELPPILKYDNKCSSCAFKDDCSSGQTRII